MYISQETSNKLKKLGIGMPSGHWGINHNFMLEPPINLIHGGDMRNEGEIRAFSYAESRLSPYLKSVGRYCSIAAEVSIGSMEHPVDWISTSNVMYDRSYWAGIEKDFRPRMVDSTSKWMTGRNFNTIENDVWIGARAIIRTGVAISTGAIIGSGTMVVKDVPPYAIVAGNPGTIKRFRFADDLIEKLLASEWWNYRYDDLGDFGFNNPEIFLDKFMNNKHLLTPYLPERKTIAEWVAIAADLSDEQP